MSPRSLVRYSQVRRTERVDSPADDSKYVLGRYFQADCQASDIVGHCVIITGPAVLAIPQVTRVDIKTTGLTLASVGVIAEKSTATRCLVMTFGELAVSFVALIPGKVYWIGADAKPTDILPVPDPGSKIAAQTIGMALDTDRLLINPERRPTIRVG